MAVVISTGLLFLFLSSMTIFGVSAAAAEVTAPGRATAGALATTTAAHCAFVVVAAAPCDLARRKPATRASAASAATKTRNRLSERKLQRCGVFCSRTSPPRRRRIALARSASAAKEKDEEQGDVAAASSAEVPPSLRVHHGAVKTANITLAMQFYRLLGFEEECRFRAGPARAAWLELADAGTRLELIEVPSYMLIPTSSSPGTAGTSPQSPSSSPVPLPKAINLMNRQELLGYNHLALDVTAQIRHKEQQQLRRQQERDGKPNGDPPQQLSLKDWIADLNATSLAQFNKTLRVALEPRQQLIGRDVYELAFVFDADGCLVELLHHQSRLQQDIVESGWEPWKGN